MKEQNDIFRPQFEEIQGKATPATDMQITELLYRGVSDVIPRELFEKKMREGVRMRVYLGADPTGPLLHIGHAVILRALRVLQDLGHEIVFLIGDFTARIGDPTGRDEMRVSMTPKEILANAEFYKEQAAHILNFDESSANPVRLAFNSEWLAHLNFEDLIQLASHFTVQQMLERDMFEKRMEDGRPIYLHEFFYPLMQGYDSVAMNVDMEVGGSDQLFNMLAGRDLHRTATGREKIVMTFELLLGLDGRKMSKSYNNYVGITEVPNEMYGKLMSLVDEQIETYWRLATRGTAAEFADMVAQHPHPRDQKMKLAYNIVSEYHGAEAAGAAQQEFVNVFQKKERPEEMVDVELNQAEWNIVDLVVTAEFAASKSEARRLVEQGGVKLNDAKIEETTTVTVASGDVLQVGKRKFAKLQVK